MKVKKKRKIKPSDIILFLIALAVAYIMIVPFVWMLSASFKLKTEIFSVPFSKLRFPGRDTLFLAYLGTMMVPWHAIMIPQFIVIQKLGLYDNHLSLILTGAFSVFGVFILRQNMLSIPDSLGEAAKIDGCGPVGIYAKVILPLTKNGLATLVVLTFNNVWNDYMGPMIYLDKEANRTIQLGLATFKREFDTNYGAIMAGTVVSLIPVVIIYIIAQKYIVDGIAYSGVKG